MEHEPTTAAPPRAPHDRLADLERLQAALERQQLLLLREQVRLERRLTPVPGPAGEGEVLREALALEASRLRREFARRLEEV
ncbi:hypothetical protein [Meiothermus hypogaeus]|uniref:DUF342 domain-containing protein n=1 Tax=Meiothermus hypogaeus NBRC 106114 TaxID=1227553 RepID=A0A511R2N5_9DEIN|nr:hypothetical protein [Meiothermus hypogaeus]GEM83873.1 hypothetical protein MHY01S_20390 [Meiothermus hypogaeus NBRC 106114]